MSLLKSKKHKELERLWYAKLKAEGFEDCENTELPERPLKQWDTSRAIAKDPIRREAATEYYASAAELLHIYQFERAIYRKIWELHSQGLSRREIEKELEKSRFKRKYRQVQIQTIIKKISKGIL